MIHAYLAAALTLIASGALADEPLTFKGFAIGADKAAIVAAFPPEDARFGCGPKLCAWMKPGRSCAPLQDKDERAQCYDRMRYGGVMLTQMMMSFRDEKLTEVAVFFPSGQFQHLATVMRDRFGTATREEEGIMQNSAGAKFENRTLIWSRDGTLLRLSQRGTSLDEGMVVFTSEQVLGQEREERRKAGAKNL